MDSEIEQVLAPAAFGLSAHTPPAQTGGGSVGVQQADPARAVDIREDALHPREQTTPGAAAAPVREPVRESAGALTAERVVRRHHRAPEGGWRRLIYRMTGGKVVPEEDRAVVERRELEARATARITGPTRFVVVLTRKGGVGKTTTTITLGQTLAALREDRVVAVDGNPDRGTLVERVTRQTSATIRDVVSSAAKVSTFGEMSALVSRDRSRLDVIASDTDPAISEAVNEADYNTTADLLSRHYAIVLTDSGTGMIHSVMAASLERADAIVLVAGTSWDEARLASETLEWLEAHGYWLLADQAVVVINAAGAPSRDVDLDEIEQHFASRCRAVVRIPHDPHLAEGAAVDLERLQPRTRHAVLRLAAAVVDSIRDPRI